ncbi:serine hydrolase [Caldinitratiruptor microaerophilus]|uniref:Serine hydrolase n=1 Tax=Caldinitratiruptor microaerophilus TaxID=671077 RepID=A0AA35CJ83_9FIRM|nr:serine hydrolase [Caldinitratiruptor microaerophilus]BDG60212.1 serine hydrolase [Caldinitratiruptor microaerophilus]
MAITDDIRALAERFSGTLGVWAQSLDTGETVEWNAEETFPAASTIKLPILYEVYKQAGEGRLDLAERLVLRAEDIVPGSGVLKDLTPGLALTVKDLATLMITVSDNTATNLLIDRVGREAVNDSMRELGLRGTHLDHKLFRAPEGAPPNRSTPADLGRLMRLIAARAVLTPAACGEMLDILGRQQYTEQITRRLPDYDGFVEPGREPAVRVASKSGAIRGTRNDVGLVEARGRRYVLALMTRGCRDLRFHPDNEASLLLADVSAALYRHFVTGS